VNGYFSNVKGAVMTYNYFLKSIPATLKVILGTRVPLRVTQYITERCNLDCHYCARHEYNGHELATNEIKSMMSLFRKAGTLFWAFNGGEALIRDDIGELVNFAKSLGMFVNISTNGTLIARKYSDIRNADLINITLEGSREIHDEMRSGSYDRMCAGIEVLNKNDIRFTFTTPINNRNIDCLGVVLDFAEKYKTKVVFQPIRLQKEDAGAKSKAFFPMREQMQQAMDYLLQEKAKGRPVANSANFLKQIKMSWPTGRPHAHCWAGKMYCSVTTSGAVTGCCDTLKTARSENEWLPEDPVKEFYLLPPFQCATCFSATSLEANIAMSICLKNPLTAIRQVVSFLPIPYWNTRH
jgi:MoaA/NifB/PqqE/SkfB family radical SAM enzyme